MHGDGTTKAVYTCDHSNCGLAFCEDCLRSVCGQDCLTQADEASCWMCPRCSDNMDLVFLQDSGVFAIKMAQRFGQIWLAQPGLSRAQVEGMVAEDVASGLFGAPPQRLAPRPKLSLGLQDDGSTTHVLSSMGSVVQQRLMQQAAAPRQVPWGAEKRHGIRPPALPLSPQLAADASKMFPRTPALSAFRTEPRTVLHPDISRGAESRPIPAVVPRSVLQGAKLDIARAARRHDPRTASVAVAAIAQQCSVRNYAPPEVALMSTLVGYNVNPPKGQGLLYGVTNEMHSEGILAVPSSDVVDSKDEKRMTQATLNDVLRTCHDQAAARDGETEDEFSLPLPSTNKLAKSKKRSRTGAEAGQQFSKFARESPSHEDDAGQGLGEVLSAPGFHPEMTARDVSLEDVWRWLDPGLEYITEYKFVPSDMNNDSVVYGVTACVCDTAAHEDYSDAAGCEAHEHPIRQKLSKGTQDVQIGGSTMTSFVASMHPQRAQELLLPMSDTLYDRSGLDREPTLVAGAGACLEYDDEEKVISESEATALSQVPRLAERMCDRCVCAGQQAHCDVAGAPCDVGYACGPACKCHVNCKGEGVSKVHLPLQVVYTGPGKGWGVWCTQDIPAGTVICKYVGEVITGLEAERRVHKGATLADGLPGDAYMYELKFRAPRMDTVQAALEDAISRGAAAGSIEPADLKLIAASSAMFSESLPFLDPQFANPVFYNDSLTKEQKASISMALTPTTLPIFEAFGLASCSAPSSTPSGASDDSPTVAATSSPSRGRRRASSPKRQAAAGVAAAVSACTASPRRPLGSSAPAAAIPPKGRRCALTGVAMSDAVETLRELQRMYPPSTGKGFVLQNDFAVTELVESGGRAGGMLPLFMRFGDLLQSNNGPMAPQNVFRGTLLNETLSASERKRYHEQRFFVVDSRTKGNVARFINHSCDPNCETIVISRHPDPLLHDVTVRAVRDIPAYTELSYDYQYEVNMNPHRKLVCHCGAPNCKGRLL